MKHFLILPFLFVCLTSFAQSDEAFRVILRPNWKEGNAKDLDGHTIVKKESKNDFEQFTNIYYLSKEEERAKYEEMADKQMWSKEKKAQLIKELETSGGSLLLSLGRSTIGWANTRNFTVIVHDSAGKELMREELKENVPDTPGSLTRLWSNMKTVHLPATVKAPFTVYVIDAVEQDKPRSIFEVKN